MNVALWFKLYCFFTTLKVPIEKWWLDSSHFIPKTVLLKLKFLTEYSTWYILYAQQYLSMGNSSRQKLSRKYCYWSNKDSKMLFLEIKTMTTFAFWQNLTTYYNQLCDESREIYQKVCYRRLRSEFLLCWLNLLQFPLSLPWFLIFEIASP